MRRGARQRLLGGLVLLSLLAPGSSRAAPSGKRTAEREQAAPADGPNQGPGFVIPSSVEFLLLVNEEAPPAALAELAALGGVTIALALQGNMLRDGAIPLLRRLPRARVVLRAPILAVHVEQLRRLPALAVELDAAGTPLDEPSARRLGQLGPRPITVRVDATAGLTEELLAPLGRIGHGRIRAFFGRRAPGPVELAALRRASADAEVELAASAPAEAVRAALGAGLAVRVVAEDDRVPRRMLAELERGLRPVAVELSGMPAASDVERLGRIPRLSALVLRLDRVPAPPVGLTSRLASLRPRPLGP